VADDPAPLDGDPLKRAAAKLASRFGRTLLEQSQPLLLVDPPGYGATRVLESFVDLCSEGECDLPGFRIGTIAERSDAIGDLTSLLVEVAAIASSGPDDMTIRRRRILDWGRDRSGAGFRQELDRYLSEVLTRVSGVVLCVPRIDRILHQFGSLVPREDWQLRGYIQANPIRLVATAPAGWRPTAEDAFFQTFWSIKPELCRAEDLDALATRMRLKKNARAALSDLSSRLGARPLLVERAAGILALEPRATTRQVLQEIARNPPAMLVEQLEAASRQALKILANATFLQLPTDAGTIAKEANVSANVVSTQMSRLADIGLVDVIRTVARDHRYDFADPVARTLYAAMVGAPDPGLPEISMARAG
jgi:hypothetical protein